MIGHRHYPQLLLSLCPCICQSICVFVCMPVYLSVRLYICRELVFEVEGDVCLFICLSV